MSLPFTLYQLRILKAIVAEKSFTRASEILFISQPTLSKQIKELEKQLGIKLIIRIKNEISLTDAGKIFLQYSERILGLCEESCRALNDFRSGDRGKLFIGASQTTGTYLMPRILALFIQDYPQINLKLHVDSTRIIVQKVLNRQIDIAIVGGRIPKKLNKFLKVEAFVKDELILILPKSHPFTFNKKKLIKKDDLYHLSFITLNSTSTIRKFIDNVLIKNKIEISQFNIVMELNSIEAIKKAVSLGLGAAFISLSAIENEKLLKTIEIVKIENITINRTLSIISNSQCYKSRAFEIFYERLCDLKNFNF